jgi:hypothetical protein
MESLGTEARMEPCNPRQALFTFLPFYPFTFFGPFFPESPKTVQKVQKLKGKQENGLDHVLLTNIN